VVQFIPGLSPILPITSILPLAFVIIVAAIKEAVEDFFRHKEDNKNNRKKYDVIRDGKVCVPTVFFFASFFAICFFFSICLFFVFYFILFLLISLRSHIYFWVSLAQTELERVKSEKIRPGDIVIVKVRLHSVELRL
jgi:4-hydroxybenzoate polyprenyltransferase